MPDLDFLDLPDLDTITESLLGSYCVVIDCESKGAAEETAKNLKIKGYPASVALDSILTREKEFE